MQHGTEQFRGSNSISLPPCFGFDPSIVTVSDLEILVNRLTVAGMFESVYTKVL